MTNRVRTNLSANVTYKLIQIFNNKSWEIEDDKGQQLGLFNRFCMLLNNLTNEQQLFILELTERFLRINEMQFTAEIIKTLKKIHNDETSGFNSYKRLFILPLIAPRDRGKIKSSLPLSYLYRGVDMSYQDFLVDKKINVISTADEFLPFVNRSDSILLVVDDFIGTGGTAVEALEELFEKNIPNHKIIVVTIACLNQGIQKVESLGVKIYCSITQGKGITDYYPTEIVQEKIAIMKAIEEKLNVKDNEKFGYLGSEALLTFVRPPNNTFPVYWHEKNSNISPFPRQKK